MTFAKELAKFFDGNSLNPHKGLQRHESGHGYDGDAHARDGDARRHEHYHLAQPLAGICTFHNSSALDLAGFQFLVLAIQRTTEDEDLFLADM